ncbi:MAG: ABC transporter substrate-binding protein [Ardenticatenaceae bacterium]|nr:ABC transporter substrate-binding protein [Ardenticatenaceae bacterium]HBY94122.1 hypothetical protein [Chloroflexota bacterium]
MTEHLNHLRTRLARGDISRRQFLQQAIALGLSASAALAFLQACTQQQPPAPGQSSGTAAPNTRAAAVPTPTEKPAPTAATDGTVRIGSSAEFNLMDPLTNSFLNDFNLLYVNLYDQLVFRQEDGSLGPGLAESWSLNSPTEWDFKLRQGVKFQNGEPFNAEAVKFTLDRFLQADDGSPFVKPSIQEAKVLDEYTVRVTTPKPDPIFLENSLYYVFPVPPKYTEEVGREGFSKHPVGTGPFKFVEWAKGDHLTLERFPDYWQGAPKIERVTFKIIPEIATRVAGLQAGELDLIMQLTPDQIPTLESFNARAVGAPVPRIIYLITFPDSPTGSGTPLKDKRVRQALNYAINVDSIIKNILLGQATRIATLAPPLAFGYDPNVTPYPYDPDKAKQLLADAGFPDGFNIDLDVPTGGNPLKPVEVGQAIAADLGKVGVNPNLRTIEAASYITYRNEKKMAPLFLWNWYGYDAHLQMWGGLSPDFKFAFWSDPRTSELLEKEATSMDPKERQAALAELQQIVKDESWFVPLYQQNEIYGVSNRLAWERDYGGHVWLWDASLKG